MSKKKSRRCPKDRGVEGKHSRRRLLVGLPFLPPVPKGSGRARGSDEETPVFLASLLLVSRTCAGKTRQEHRVKTTGKTLVKSGSPLYHG